MGLAVRLIPRKEALEELAKAYSDFRPYHIEAIQAIFQLTADLEKALEKYFVKNKFSRARFLVLMVLINQETQRMTPNEIAKQLNVTRGNMTGLIDCLLASKLVTKIQDNEDRRQVWIEVTSKGKKFLEEVLPDYFKRLAKFMSVLKKEEVEMLINVSRKLHGTIKEFEE